MDYIKYKHKYKDQVIDFLSEHLGLGKKKRREKFEWRYVSNPYTESPLVYLAIEDDKIVGIRGYVVQKYALKDKKYFFAIPTSTLVHPKYRRQGIFTNLTNFASDNIRNRDEIDLFMSLSSNEKSSSGNIKAGYEPIGRRKKSYYLSFINSLKSNALEKSDEELPLEFFNKEKSFKVTDQLKPSEISELMNTYSNEEKLMHVIDSEFYEWKFGESPYESFFICCYEGTDLRGYIGLEKRSLSLYSFHKFDFYMIKEFGYLEESVLEGMLKILKNNLSISAIMAYMFTRRDEEISIFEKNGFSADKISLKLLHKIFPTGRILDSHLPGALIKPVSEEFNESDLTVEGKDLTDPKNWSLFHIDVN